MIRPAMILLLLLLGAPLCAPLRAEHESNFGRVILANSDLIVQGVAGAKRTRIGSALQVQVTVQTVLYGEEKASELTVYFTDDNLLPKNEAVRALFALKRLAQGGCNLVGKPVLTAESDAEEQDKLSVVREFVQLERAAAGEQRTADFFALLLKHIDRGGYSAQNAAVELMFVVRDRGSIVTQERFDALLEARKAADARLTTATRDDLTLVQQGMVEVRIKGLKFKAVRRAEKQAERRAAADELLKLISDYPRAFTLEDAKLAEALSEASDDDRLKKSLDSAASEIRKHVAIAEAAEKAKQDEAARRIRHADGR